MGESHLEAYNRVYNLLRSLSHSLVASRWNDKYVKAQPFEATQIHESAVIRWMGLVMELQTSKPLGREPPKPLTAKQITLLWNRKTKTKTAANLERHIEEYVQFQKSTLPNERKAASKDPRRYPTGEMWRDTVRRQLLLQDLRLELSTTRVEIYI